LHQYLGVARIASDQGRGSISIVVKESSMNPAGFLHGGVLYALCDVCAYAGLLSRLEPGREAVTHDMHVSVLQAAKAGDRVDFSSAIVKMGRKICFIDVTATVGETPIATARVTKSLVENRAGG